MRLLDIQEPTPISRIRKRRSIRVPKNVDIWLSYTSYRARPAKARNRNSDELRLKFSPHLIRKLGWEEADRLELIVDRLGWTLKPSPFGNVLSADRRRSDKEIRLFRWTLEVPAGACDGLGVDECTETRVVESENGNMLLFKPPVVPAREY